VGTVGHCGQSYGEEGLTIEIELHWSVSNAFPFSGFIVLSCTAPLRYTGTSLSWYGMVPNGTTDTLPFVRYTIDGGSPVLFNIKRDHQVTEFKQILFTTPYLEPSEHSLIVTYLGNSSDTGLMLNYMYVMNITIPPFFWIDRVQ